MSIEIMTKSDLMDFKSDLFKELKTFLAPEKPTDKKWLRSSEVRKLLGISGGTLQTLRNNGTLSFTKIGGTMFYSREEIDKILQFPTTQNILK